VNRLHAHVIALAATVALAAVGCSKPAPTPPAMPPGGGPINVTGHEQLGWDQMVADRTELGTIGYTVYVDAKPQPLGSSNCATTATATTFDCKAPLPSMSPGTHTLELAAFYLDTPQVESAHAGPLTVVVTALTAAEPSHPNIAASKPQRPDAPWPASAVHVVDGLLQPTDLAFTPDGRLWIAERSGRIVMVQDGALAREPALTTNGRAIGAGAVLAVAADPRFASDHLMYAVYTDRSRSGQLTFALARYREVGGTLAERIVLLDDVPASSDPHAALRFGPDGKLYAAFDDADDGRLPDDLASYNGKVLRLNPDGTTPDDAPRKSPVFVSGLTSPRGLAWHRASGRLWAGDRTRVGSVRWTSSPTAVSAHGDTLMVGSDAGLIRAGIDKMNPARLSTTQDVLRNIAVQAVTTAPDGTTYFATATAVGRVQ
jgi:hypothetical protein